MKNTTLCYIRRGEEYLMLHRIKKENDENRDKWIGVGGKCEEGESPEECVCREVLEETGLVLEEYALRGIVTFVSDVWPAEYMFLFTADRVSGDIKECDEGQLEWISRDALYRLTMWEGDKIFLRFLQEERPFFSLKLEYRGERLVGAALNGAKMQL